ncbi:MAG TPA: PH domain-containing protein, partial [Fimbriimonas sp.]|nr:PH domain-containing protein [Fimbriimonas sp.]
KVWRYSAMLSGLIPCIMVAGLVALFTKVSKGPVLVFAVLGFVLGVLLFVVLPILLATRQYERWRYKLTPESLVIRKGLLYQSERYIARDRVQHIDINSGPFDRKFGLVQVVVYAAGATGSVGLIPGLPPEEADWLRSQLIPREEILEELKEKELEAIIATQLGEGPEPDGKA